MPTFHTPDPIAVTLELGVGDIRIIAGERTDTVVEVRPTDESRTSDVAAAHHLRVEYSNGALLIRAPKSWQTYRFRGGADSVDVRIELPAGSHVRGTAGLAALHCAGRLGECRYGTGLGDIHVDDAESVDLKTGAGDVGVGRARRAVVTTGSGTVRIGAVSGSAVIKNSNGDTWISEVVGDLRVSAANGTIAVDQAHATVVAKTANGDVRLGEVVHGAIVAHTAFGAVDVGVREGVAAWLDLHTGFGHVRNDLIAARSPGPGEEAVDVRGRTSYGDITIRRTAPTGTSTGGRSGSRTPDPHPAQPVTT